MLSKLKLSSDLVYVFSSSASSEGAIIRLARLLKAKGFVKDSYGEAVLEREKVYPTGLPTEPIGIAIPHTDPEHVNVGAIAVGILKQPVVFYEMGTLDSPVSVKVITMLAIQDGASITGVLKKLATSFQSRAFLEALASADRPQTVVELFTSYLADVVEVV